MRKLIHIIFFLIMTVNFMNGQNSQFRFAERAFKENYEKASFERFRGKISEPDAITIIFDDKVVTVYDIMPVHKTIFQKGIFYPNLILGDSTTKLLPKPEIAKMSAEEKLFYNLTRNDSITITNFKSLDELNPNIKTKRFMFWVFNIGRANPTEYYIELQNKYANGDTTLEEFINGSILTFWRRGTIII